MKENVVNVMELVIVQNNSLWELVKFKDVIIGDELAFCHKSVIDIRTNARFVSYCRDPIVVRTRTDGGIVNEDFNLSKLTVYNSIFRKIKTKPYDHNQEPEDDYL